jgi:hypothetical protein
MKMLDRQTNRKQRDYEDARQTNKQKTKRLWRC